MSRRSPRRNSRGIVQPIKHVAVIGAGVSGVAATAHLKAAGLQVTIFERARQSGGVWCVFEWGASSSLSLKFKLTWVQGFWSTTCTGAYLSVIEAVGSGIRIFWGRRKQAGFRGSKWWSQKEQRFRDLALSPRVSQSWDSCGRQKETQRLIRGSDHAMNYSQTMFQQD